MEDGNTGLEFSSQPAQQVLAVLFLDTASDIATGGPWLSGCRMLFFQKAEQASSQRQEADVALVVIIWW